MFTATPLAGNGLAVVHDAGGVPDDVMHATARETRLSESTFLQPATDPQADYRNRIWTPAGELPFAGHPSLGSAVATARLHNKTTASYVQQTGAGLQPIDVELSNMAARASMLQEPAEFGPELDPEEVLRAVRLDPKDADPAMPPQVVSTGLRHAIVPVRTPDAVRRIRPNWEAIGALVRPHGATAVYVAHVDVGGETARARSFADDIGEDPATGSAAGPLLALAHARAGITRLTVTQGVEMGRTSILRASVEQDRIRLGGDAVILLEGRITLPAGRTS